RAFTAPASWIAPPNSSSFSVSVVLPASGCAMIANERRFAIGAGRASDTMAQSTGARPARQPVRPSVAHRGARRGPRLLEEQAAVGAGAVHERRGRPAGGAGRLVAGGVGEV